MRKYVINNIIYALLYTIGCCLDTIVMEITTGDISYAGGGPHSVEITVNGESQEAVDVLSAGRNERKLIAIDLSDLGFSSSCIKPKDIDNIVLVANSNDGIYFIYIEFYATFSVKVFDNNRWVDGNGAADSVRVPVLH